MFKPRRRHKSTGPFAGMTRLLYFLTGCEIYTLARPMLK